MFYIEFIFSNTVFRAKCTLQRDYINLSINRNIYIDGFPYARFTFLAIIQHQTILNIDGNVVLDTGVYIVPCNLIFFPTLIFLKFDFLPQNFSPLSLLFH